MQDEDNSWPSCLLTATIPGAKASLQAARGKREFVQDPRPHPGLCQVLAPPPQISIPIPTAEKSHSYFFSLLTQLPTPCIRPSQLCLLACLWKWQFHISFCTWNCATAPGYFYASLIAKCSIAPSKRREHRPAPAPERISAFGFKQCSQNPQESPG